MQKKPIQFDRGQTDFAAQLAHDQLHRNNSYYVDEVIASRVSPSSTHKIRHHVNCIDRKLASRDSVLMGLDSFPLYNDPQAPSDPIFIQKVKIYSDKIVRYPVRYDDGSRSTVSDRSKENLTRGLFKGYISKESGRVIRKRLEAWIKAVQINKDVNSKYRNPDHSHIVFATLTLPSTQQHSDNDIKRSCLMPFFQALKRKHGVGEYFWSAEPQKNGNIHFHILVDRYIDKDRLNDQWLMATNTLGYYDRYIQATNDINPPATKINVCPQDMSLVNYIMKYVSKQPEIRCSYKEIEGKGTKRVSYWASEEFKGGADELLKHGYDLEGINVEHRLGRWYGKYERRPIEGRSWGMSKGLLNLDVYSTEATYRVNDLLTIAEYSPQVGLLKVDHAELYFMNVVDFMAKHDPVLLADYRKYYLHLYRSIYHPPEVAEVIPISRAQVSDPIYKSCTSAIQLRMAV